jgi:hypothetical protein
MESSYSKIRKEINRIRRRLHLPHKINNNIYRLFREIRRCSPNDHIVSTDALKVIPFLFMISLNSNDFFLSADKLAQISYVNINEVLSIVEPLYRFKFDATRVSSQTILTYSFTFQKYRKRYAQCPLCDHNLDEEYLRLFYIESPYLKERLRKKTLANMKDSETFKYVYDRRLTVKIPCILCFLQQLTMLNELVF